MTFDVSLATQGRTAVITMAGELDDDANAARFREKVLQAVAGGIDRLVLETSGLARLSAAGLRGLIFCSEKLPNNVDVVVVAPSKSVLDTIDHVGFQQSVTISDTVPQ